MLMVSVGQEFRSGLAGWFWLTIPHEAANRMMAVTVIV